MFYKKVKLLGFIPFFKKITIKEARSKIETIEVLLAYKNNARLNEIIKTRPIDYNAGSCEFKIGGQSESQ